MHSKTPHLCGALLDVCRLPPQLLKRYDLNLLPQELLQVIALSNPRQGKARLGNRDQGFIGNLVDRHVLNRSLIFDTETL